MKRHHPIENHWNELVNEPDAAGTLHVATGDGELECALSEVNPIACRLKRLSFYSERIADADAERLTDLGEALCRRVTYLMEPLAVQEIDREASHVLLRSAAPSRGDDGRVSYFEGEISRQRGLRFERYEASRGSAREPASAALTRETLQRLIDDCIGAADETLK